MERAKLADHETRPALAEKRLAVVLVGLPARGKTTLAKKLARYVAWLGLATRTFNVGSYRRARLGSRQRHDFFDPSNPEGEAKRLDMAHAALDDMLAWLDGSEAAARGAVAFYDATNTTRQRRGIVARGCAERGVDVLFVETLITDAAVIEANVRAAKISSPDYLDLEPEDAARDFRKRIGHYERAYEALGQDEGSGVRVFDFGSSIEVNGVRGELPLRVLSFIVRSHGQPRRIWLTRHGESEFNVAGRIGGDAPLTDRGRAYASRLAELLEVRTGGEAPIVWTSCLRRTIETAAPLRWATRPWRALDEIHAGSCEGLTYTEIARAWPAEFAARAADKLRYRYPRGESYEDVIERLDPVVLELESARRPVLVVAHQAVLRALYCYLTDRTRAECPRISLPLHTLLELRLSGGVWEEDRWALDDQDDRADGESVEGPLADPDRNSVEGPLADPDRNSVEGPLADPDRN